MSTVYGREGGGGGATCCIAARSAASRAERSTRAQLRAARGGGSVSAGALTYPPPPPHARLSLCSWKAPCSRRTWGAGEGGKGGHRTNASTARRLSATAASCRAAQRDVPA